jgi:hypothetical protein
MCLFTSLANYAVKLLKMAFDPSIICNNSHADFENTIYDYANRLHILCLQND